MEGRTAAYMRMHLRGLKYDRLNLALGFVRAQRNRKELESVAESLEKELADVRKAQKQADGIVNGYRNVMRRARSLLRLCECDGGMAHDKQEVVLRITELVGAE